MPQRDASPADAGRTKNVHLGVNRFQEIKTKKKSCPLVRWMGLLYIAHKGGGNEKISEPVMLLLL